MDHEIQLYITVTPVTVPVVPGLAPPAPPTAAGKKTGGLNDILSSLWTAGMCWTTDWMLFCT